ncbi:MAG TPA: alpha-amylase family protein [Bacteroidia bacterium]|nr:alpha-amylase family protein [Bacteroidia bacterium]
MIKHKQWLWIIIFPLVIAPVSCSFFTQKTGKEDNFTRLITTEDTTKLWYKSASFYTLDVEVFKDSDGDGFGDFKGLTQKLGYIDSLGFDAIWLAPFQPTPGKDDGYDVADFYSVDKNLGTLEDFKAFINSAKEKNIRIIMDLVINHTSIEHPWFKEARQSKGSRYRNWYTWSGKRPSNYDKGMVFPGVQKTTWTLDTVSNEYYYHRFYEFQPDLNTQNEEVKAEIKKIIKYWTDLGIAGFRLDGVPFYIEVPETKGNKFERKYEMLVEMRKYVESIRPDAIILGEANVPPEENELYFGKNGDGMHMMFNFWANQHLFLSLATDNPKPIKKALEASQDIPYNSQWGQFLRNHDEVDLGRLTNRERNKVFERFGPEKRMQSYDRGIRRRMGPMMANNAKHLKMAYSVLFAMPSTPVVRYGEEIGMGDNLFLEERLSVRTPMQWSDDKHGGFTTGNKTVRPVIDTGEYRYQKVNVAYQQADSLSLLRFVDRLVELRKTCPEIAFGKYELLDIDKHILAIKYSWQGKELIAVHNFSPEIIEFTLENISGYTELLKSSTLTPVNSKHTMALDGYGFGWYRTQ